MEARICCTLLIVSALLLVSCGSQTAEDVDAVSFQNDPDIAAIVNPSGGQLTVAYANPDLQAGVNADYVAGEWEYMRNCLAVDAAAPVVLVIDGWIDSVDSEDVLFNIQGRRLATSSKNQNGASLIRISSYDFDGSQGNPGFHLRSILGRYLWSQNNLLASGYDTRCASRL